MKWKDIEGFEGIYQVSDSGMIRSLDRIDCAGRRLVGKIKKSVKDKDGYLQIRLSKDGITQTCKVHRLVAAAFIPNPFEFSQINHRDENKTNNAVDNLEWCNCKYNICYGTARDRAKRNTDYYGHAKKHKRPVTQMDVNGKIVKLWGGAVDASKTLGICGTMICKCCRGIQETAGDYIWRYT